ncbi:LysR family transcriptional regulator [Lachnospiraceae bacterium 62-35]
MTIGFEMFILAAEELNFTRAAERAFVTQQCLSDHIKRLEETYHITLFKRKPHLQLTDEGHAMLKYLSRIKALEDSMVNELSDINSGVRGTLHWGISTTRGAIVIPKLIPAFQKRFSNVDVQVQLADTRYLEQKLLNGKIDIFLGVDSNQHALFHREKVYDDPIYLVISKKLLEVYLETRNEQIMSDFSKGIDLKQFHDLPFVQGHPSSTTTYAINQFLLQHNIHLNIPIFVSNFDIMIDLCQSGQYATITPSFHLSRLMKSGESKSDGKQLLILPIKNFSHQLNVEIITHKDASPLIHRQVFKELLRDCLLAENYRVKEFIRNKNKESSKPDAHAGA